MRGRHVVKMDHDTASKLGGTWQTQGRNKRNYQPVHLAPEEVRSCLKNHRLKGIGSRACGEGYSSRACKQAVHGVHLSRDLGFFFLKCFHSFPWAAVRYLFNLATELHWECQVLELQVLLLILCLYMQAYICYPIAYMYVWVCVCARACMHMLW